MKLTQWLERVGIGRAARMAGQVEDIAGSVQAHAERLAGLEKALARLPREQAKLTMLWEENLAAHRRTADQLESVIGLLRAAQDTIAAQAEARGRAQASEHILAGLLALVDDLHQAAVSLQEQATAAPEFAPWAGALRALHRRGEELLATWQLSPVPGTGAPFDPTVHRPVQVVTSTEVLQPTVVGEVQRGYYQGNVLYRPALVVVAKPQEVREDQQ